MFFVEGWLTIYQVWGTFIRFRISHPDLQEYPRGEHPFKGPAWDQFLEDFFGLCISCDDVGILLSNGETVIAASFFLYSFSIEDKAHRYFSIPRGIVGHGSLSERFVAEEIEEDFSKLTQKDLENAPKAEFNTLQYDFGTVKSGDPVNYDFVLKNTGKTDLIIRKIKASCGCTTATPSKSVLKPGESTGRSTSFRTAGYSGRQGKTITVITNDPRNSTLILRLTGNVDKIE